MCISLLITIISTFDYFSNSLFFVDKFVEYYLKKFNGSEAPSQTVRIMSLLFKFFL